MTKISERTISRGRRQFLKTALVAGAAGAATATIARGVVMEVRAPAPGAESVPPRGYEESEHVRAYYRSARF